MRYVALIRSTLVRRVQTAIGNAGELACVPDVRALLDLMHTGRELCLIVDPTLLTFTGARALAAEIAITPQPVVAYTPAVAEALEPSVVLAQRTAAQFVFQEARDEKCALARALLLVSDGSFGDAIIAALEPGLGRLPRRLYLTIADMLRSGIGPSTRCSLSARSGISSRSMDRALALAGVRSSRFLIAAARLIYVYRAIVASNIPFRTIAGMAGHASQRTLDHHCCVFFGRPSAWLRKYPPPLDDAVRRIAAGLVVRCSGEHLGCAVVASVCATRSGKLETHGRVPRVRLGSVAATAVPPGP